MKYLVVDTCVVLHIMRSDTKGKQALDFIEKQDDEPLIVVSTVTKAELESLKIQLKW